VSKRPAFGIVGAPVDTTPTPGGQRQAVDVTAYGFVPVEQLRADRGASDPALDACAAAARRGDWRTVAATVPPVDAEPDRHARALLAVAELAVEDDAWLGAWLDAAPQDANAWCVHGEAMVILAWRLRTGQQAKDVLPEQWRAFHRVLSQAPAACERATALAPHLATPRITLMSCAQGLSWDNDRFRELWAGILARAPYSVAAHLRALNYWLPRWKGSPELAAAFVNDTESRAPLGQLLSGVRLLYIFLERARGTAAERSAYHRGPELREALDAALADLAAAPPDHPYRSNHRHWLAYFLTKAGRYAEAVEEFRAVDGFAGSGPWKMFDDPASTFASTRAEAVRGAQEANGLPGASGLPGAAAR
jgi:hypothetical protein